MTSPLRHVLAAAAAGGSEDNEVVLRRHVTQGSKQTLNKNIS